MIKKIKSILKKLLGINLKNNITAEPIKNKFDGTNVIGDSGLIKIGESVSFGGNVTLFANATIEIGDHTMVAINATLHTSTHNYDLHPMWLERIDKPIKIGKHVWIGTGAIIMPGVIVDDYSVIGAGSVVTSNIPTFAIVAGNPAKIIKYRKLTTALIQTQVNAYHEGSFITRGTYNESDKVCKAK